MVLPPKLHPRSPSLNMRLTLSLHQIERRKGNRRKDIPPHPIPLVRSATAVISTHQVLHLLINRHRIKSLKHGHVEMVPK
jgi:hypothetical protein